MRRRNEETELVCLLVILNTSHLTSKTNDAIKIRLVRPCYMTCISDGETAALASRTAENVVAKNDLQSRFFP